MLSLYSILFFVIGVSFIFLIKGGNLAQKILTPLGLFTLYHSFIFYLMPFLEVTFGVARFPYLFDNFNIEIYFSLFLAFIYQLSVTFVVLSFGKTSFDYSVFHQAAKKTTVKMNLAKLLCTVLLAVGIFVMARLAFEYINNFAFFMFNRINILSGYGYFSKMLAFSIPLGIILLCGSQRNNGYLSYFAILILFLSVFIVSLLIGSRAQALFLIPFLFMTWVFTSGKKIRLGILFRGGAFLFGLLVFASFLSGLRDDIKRDEPASYSENINFDVGKVVVEELKNSYSHTELLAFLLLHKQEIELAGGQTYVAGLVSFVPRVFWKDKPVGAGPMLANIVKPGTYSLGDREGNSSLTTGIIIESYMNFSFIGIILFSFIHGFLLSKITYFSERVKDPLDIALFLITTHFLSMIIVNAEFLGAFSAYLFVILPLYLIKKVSF